MSSVKPYSEDGSKKEQVADMFDAISTRYDLLNRVLSMGIDTLWRRRTVKAIRHRKAKNILDVATGTGDLAIALSKIPGSRITGADISKGMLEVGRQKIAARKLDDRIELVLGDGEKLPFDDNHFDAATVAFGVRNFENLQAGLQDMRRVIKPGGTLAVLEFSQPQSFPFRQIYFFYFRAILPFVGRLVSKDRRAYTYLPESVEAFPYGQAFVDELKQAGYESIGRRPLTFGIATLYLAKK